MNSIRNITIACFFICSMIGHGFEIMPYPVSVEMNMDKRYSLINSVDFHPRNNLFCVTYTQNNKVSLYSLDGDGHCNLVQTLKNSKAAFSHPQHAVFSPSGDILVVANWSNQSLTFYKEGSCGLYSSTPSQVIPPISLFEDYRPHGMAFSPDGKWLAIAYGASSDYGRGVGIFRVMTDDKLILIDMLKKGELEGTPKGITFSPDGTALLVTFSDTNNLIIYTLDSNKKIVRTPKQVVGGEETGIFRPEDVKITPDGKYCALSNSEIHTVTFYPFDCSSNTVFANSPSFTLQNPDSELCFPHGIAFSPDGSFMVITEFGDVDVTDNGDIKWGRCTSPSEAKFHIYKTNFK